MNTTSNCIPGLPNPVRSPCLAPASWASVRAAVLSAKLGYGGAPHAGCAGMRSSHGVARARPLYALVTPETVWRVLLIAAGLTVITTIRSLSELNQLIQRGNPGANRLDWRLVAGRAVKHAETLPHLPHLQRAHFGVAAPAAGAAASNTVPGIVVIPAGAAAAAAASSIAAQQGEPEEEEDPGPPPPEECHAQENTE